jgi:hypothetical protein
MENIREFIESVFIKEADAWTKDELNNLDDFNQTVRALHSFAIDKVGKGFGIFERDELVFEQNPITYKPRHLFKISAYKNQVYGDVWVAYASGINPRSEIGKSVISHGFIVGMIENEIKILGTMMIHKNRSTMKVQGWKGNIYNPDNLDIKKIGKFLSAERYHEPDNYDDFSLKEYLKDA